MIHVGVIYRVNRQATAHDSVSNMHLIDDVHRNSKTAINFSRSRYSWVLYNQQQHMGSIDFGTLLALVLKPIHTKLKYYFDFLGKILIKVGVNPSLRKEMWLLMRLLTKKACTKMYKSIHFWKQKKQMNPMVATDFCKIMRFSRNSSITMVTIEFFLDSITKIWFY